MPMDISIIRATILGLLTLNTSLKWIHFGLGSVYCFMQWNTRDFILLILFGKIKIQLDKKLQKEKCFLFVFLIQNEFVSKYSIVHDNHIRMNILMIILTNWSSSITMLDSVYIRNMKKEWKKNCLKIKNNPIEY